MFVCTRTYRELSLAWNSRVGSQNTNAPTHRVQALFNDLGLYPTSAQGNYFQLLYVAKHGLYLTFFVVFSVLFIIIHYPLLLSHSCRDDAVRDEMRQQRFAGLHDVRRVLLVGQKTEKWLGQRVNIQKQFIIKPILRI